MKKLLLCLFLVVGLFAEDTYKLTEEDLAMIENDGLTIDTGITFCNTDFTFASFHICQALSATKEFNLIYGSW